jgi:hypothetical protein
VSCDSKAAVAARGAVVSVAPVSRALVAELIVSNVVPIAWAVHEDRPLPTLASSSNDVGAVDVA